MERVGIGYALLAPLPFDIKFLGCRYPAQESRGGWHRRCTHTKHMTAGSGLVLREDGGKRDVGYLPSVDSIAKSDAGLSNHLISACPSITIGYTQQLGTH